MFFAVIYEIFVAILFSLTLMHIYSYFLEARIKKLYIFLIMVSLELICYFLSLVMGEYSNLLLIVYPFVALFFYSGTMKIKLIYSSLSLLCVFAATTALEAVYTLLLPDHMSVIISEGPAGRTELFNGIPIVSFLYLILNAVYRIIFSLFTKQRISDIPLSKSLSFALLPLVQFASFIFTFQLLITVNKISDNIKSHSGSSEYLGYIILFSLIFIVTVVLDIFLFITVNRNNKARQIEYRYNELNTLLDSKYSYFMQINELYKKERVFTHDVKNKLIAVADYVEREKKEDALSVISELCGDLSSFNRYHYCENELINVVLSRKFDEAECKDIKITCEIKIGKIAVSELDLCSVISNVLDNAIETCGDDDITEKHIDFKMKSSGVYLIIYCSNPYTGTIAFNENGLPVTKKSDKDRHGFGCYILKELTDKYDGHLSISTDNGIFTIKAIFANVDAS